MTAREKSQRGRGVTSRLVLYATSALALAALVAACTSRSQQGAETAAPAARAATSASTSKAPSAAASPAAAPAHLSPTDAALQLQALLGQHTVLAADLMRARLRGDPDLAQAANSALGKNTDAMGALIGALFGDPARKAFASLWAAHIAALFNYARGLADHDDAVRKQAESSAVTYERQLAGFFSAASQGRLKQADAAAAVKTHIDHLFQQADAYAAGNYRQADMIYREGYAHAFGLGKVLAATLLPPKIAATLNDATWRLRSELDQLLGEHVVVVIAAMRAGVTNSADFSAAAETVNGNTRDLAGAIDTLFGQAAAQKFQSLWANHVDALISYSAAVVKHDNAQQAAEATKLSTFETQFAAFLGGAVQKRMTSGGLANAFRMHDDMLLTEAQAFVGKDYRQAHDVAYSAYQDMFTLAGQLASAFGATVASRLPVGAVQTGRGGMAAVVEGRWHGG